MPRYRVIYNRLVTSNRDARYTIRYADAIWTTPICRDRRVALRLAARVTGRRAEELRLELLKEKKT